MPTNVLGITDNLKNFTLLLVVFVCLFVCLFVFFFLLIQRERERSFIFSKPKYSRLLEINWSLLITREGSRRILVVSR